MRVTVEIPQKDLEKLVAPAIAEPHVSISDVSWAQYEQLLTLFTGKPGLRLTYLESTLEIMTNSPEHEMIKKMIARLLESYALERDIALYSYGSATFRREASAKGLEPDESYGIGSRKEFPDLAIEVVISSGGLDKLEVYRGLQVAEVWFWQADQLTLYTLNPQDVTYQAVSRSQFFPDLDPAVLATYIRPEAEHATLKAWRDLIRSVPGASGP